MATRRSVRRTANVGNNNNYSNLKISGVLCPICRSILIEPVTLPCNHGFCSSCFEGTIANANLVCPLCRVRIGSWLRTSKKDNKLINTALWEAIQKTFPEQVKNKLAGNEEYPEEDVPRHLTAPGEIRREYEIQKVKEELEFKKQHEAESKASEAFIKKLKEREEYEEAVREENLRLSEQVAKKLSKEYCFDPGPSSSKSGIIKSNSKKEGPIDRLLKNMTQKKLTVTLQHGAETSKEYTCRILCQDRNAGGVNKYCLGKAALNWGIQDKLRKIVAEGEASDSNDSIDSECRYFKPIEQRYIPISRKVPIIKVPAVMRTANTVIIGPPKGETKFTYAALGSAFVEFKFPGNTPKKETIIKSKDSGLKLNSMESMCDTTITELPLVNKTPVKFIEASPKKHTRNNSQVTESFGTPRKYETRNRGGNKVNSKVDEKTPEKNMNYDSLVSYTTPSKRKRLRSSPDKEETVNLKRVKLFAADAVVSPPFYGFNDKNLDELTEQTNGAITLNNTNHNNTLFSDGNIKNNLKKLQEEEDWKFAKQLHDELNNRSRYSTRNSISLPIKKPSARQVTLKEIISQTVSKIP